MRRIRKELPSTVIRRFTRYMSHLQDVRDSGTQWVSSQEIADALGLTSSTVRQDFSHLDFSGTSRRGYNVRLVCEVLSRILGGDKVWKSAVVGAGNLGTALVLHDEFRGQGFDICCIFDSDRRKVGKTVGSLKVQPMDKMGPLVSTLRVDIGVIAVPPAVAQSVADLLILAGVKGLLNLASTHITVPERIGIAEARIAASLQELSHAIMMKSSLGS